MILLQSEHPDISNQDKTEHINSLPFSIVHQYHLK